jgi:hypothetical protein
MTHFTNRKTFIHQSVPGFHFLSCQTSVYPCHFIAREIIIGVEVQFQTLHQVSGEGLHLLQRIDFLQGKVLALEYILHHVLLSLMVIKFALLGQTMPQFAKIAIKFNIQQFSDIFSEFFINE